MSDFEPLVVHDAALHEKFLEDAGGSNAELGRLVAVHPVAHGDDGIEIVVFGLVW
jgi:hypothetical protein